MIENQLLAFPSWLKKLTVKQTDCYDIISDFVKITR